jgi:ABC-type multidrug transport system ATPase subunit
VLIARALLPDPELLLLEEPTTGLDVASRERYLRTIDDLHAARPDLATVTVTHHLEELSSTTTHALLIVGGRVLAADPVADVLPTGHVSACVAPRSRCPGTAVGGRRAPASACPEERLELGGRRAVRRFFEVTLDDAADT